MRKLTDQGFAEMLRKRMTYRHADRANQPQLITRLLAETSLLHKIRHQPAMINNRF